MDNVTHTLIGVVAGETLALSPAGRARRGACVALVTIASNLPDADLLYTYLGAPHDKLNYMLGHRGYTHTVIGCIVLALVLYATAAAVLRRRSALTLRDHVLLGGASLLGAALHLSMDALNSYGVHPFWPVWNHWIYGDAVFIVEPFYWAAAAPLVFVMRSWTARVLIALAVAASVILSIATGVVLVASWLALLALIALLIVAGARSSARTATLLSAGTMLGVTLIFCLAALMARERIASLAAAQFAEAHPLDAVLTPMPANPLCWDVILLQRIAGQYVARHGMLSVAPRLISAERCPMRAVGLAGTAVQGTVAAGSSASIHWLSQYQTPIARFAHLVQHQCIAARAMQFLRAPFLATYRGGEVIGDLRFDREAELGFSELELPGPATARTHCPRPAPWSAPRGELLR